MKSLSIETTYQFWSQFKKWQNMFSPKSKTQCLVNNKSHSDCNNDFFKMTFFIIAILHKPMKKLPLWPPTNSYHKSKQDNNRIHDSPKVSAWVTKRVTVTAEMTFSKWHFSSLSSITSQWQVCHVKPPPNSDHNSKNDKTCFHQSTKLSCWLTTRVTVTATMTFSKWHFSSLSSFTSQWPPTNSYHKSKQDNNRTHHSPKVSDWMTKRVTVTAEMTV